MKNRFLKSENIFSPIVTVKMALSVNTDPTHIIVHRKDSITLCDLDDGSKRVKQNFSTFGNPDFLSRPKVGFQ